MQPANPITPVIAYIFKAITSQNERLQTLTQQMAPKSLHFLSFLLLLTTVYAQLRVDYYRHSCPNVEAIVRSAVKKKFQQTFVTAPSTLRLFFHDCFVRVSFLPLNSTMHVNVIIARLSRRSFAMLDFLCYLRFFFVICFLVVV